MAKKITQSMLANLENSKNFILIESEIDYTTYAVEKTGKGLYVISGGIAFPIGSCNVEKFANELLRIWNAYKTGNIAI